MFYQGLFRLIKWIITGDARTILAQKHDTRPHMILLRLLIVIVAALGLLGVIVILGSL